MQFLMAIDLCRTENGRKRKKNECTAQTVTVAMWTQLRKKITIIMLHFLGTLFVFVHVVCVVSAYVSRMSFPFEFLPGGLLDIFLSFSSSRSPSYPLFYSSSWYARLIRPTVCVQFAIHPDECFDHLLFEGKKSSHPVRERDAIWSAIQCVFCCWHSTSKLATVCVCVLCAYAREIIRYEVFFFAFYSLLGVLFLALRTFFSAHPDFLFRLLRQI